MQQVGASPMLETLESPSRARPGLGALDSVDGRQIKKKRKKKKERHWAEEENVGGLVFV